MKLSTMYRPTSTALAMLLLAACGNPQESAQSAIQDAHSAWQVEAADMDPTQRLQRYDAIIADVKAVADDYPETRHGQAIAAGREIDGVSLANMQRARDRLAPRAACYAQPTVACLQPFSSHPGGRGQSASSGDAFATAQRLVCASGFAAADRALEDFKINRPAYAKQVAQVALAASACHKPAAVIDAVRAWLAATPADADARAQTLMTILATDALQPAWPLATTQLESVAQTPGLPANRLAGIDVTLAVAYAKAGDSKAALQKYHAVTDTLHYQFDYTSREALVTQLILSGHAEDGLKLVQYPTQLGSSVRALNRSAGVLGARLKLASTTTTPSLDENIALADYSAPPPPGEQATALKSAQSIETALDSITPQITRPDDGVGITGADQAYGMLSMIWQKLGNTTKANAALAKGEAVRNRLLGAGGRPSANYFGECQVTLALMQGDPDRAARYAATLQTLYQYEKAIVTAMAGTGDVEKALAYIGTLGNRANRNDYEYVIDGLVAAGQIDKAEQVIKSIPGGTRSQSRHYWKFVSGMAMQGDAEAAQAYAKAHGLTSDPRDRLRLLNELMNAPKIADDRKLAEPIVREIFDILQASEANASTYAGRRNRYNAQTAATLAFRHGYTDLGIELYNKAANRDQRPLLHAFSDKMKPAQMTPVLMLAQDNLDGTRLQYVIDAAIRHLSSADGAAAVGG